MRKRRTFGVLPIRFHSPRLLTVIDNLLLKILFLDLLILACLLWCLSGYSSLLRPLITVLPPGSALEARLLLFIPSPPSTHAASTPRVTSWPVLGPHVSCKDRSPRTSYGYLKLNISKLQLTVFLTLMAFIMNSLFLTSFSPLLQVQ